jgi:hypothetical protein
MTTKQPKWVLDTLIIGTAPSDDPAWAALVRSPDGTGEWKQAMERREHLNRVAAVVEGRPWLAEALLRVRRETRTAARAISSAWSVAVVQSPTTVLLGPENGTQNVALIPHRVTIVEVGLGDTVQVVAPEGALVTWTTASGTGSLTSAKWRLDKGDAPVLLVGGVAMASETNRPTGPEAVIVLVERAEGEMER